MKYKSLDGQEYKVDCVGCIQINGQNFEPDQIRAMVAAGILTEVNDVVFEWVSGDNLHYRLLSDATLKIWSEGKWHSSYITSTAGLFREFIRIQAENKTLEAQVERLEEIQHDWSERIKASIICTDIFQKEIKNLNDQLNLIREILKTEQRTLCSLDKIMAVIGL